jgi:hypothetical protein
MTQTALFVHLFGIHEENHPQKNKNQLRMLNDYGSIIAPAKLFCNRHRSVLSHLDIFYKFTFFFGWQF